MKKSWQLDRRTFLRGAGMSMALPMMEAMVPAGRAAAAQAAQQPMRMLCIGMHLGVHAPAFFPKQAGANYTPPTLLKPLNEFRKDFTVFSNLDHAGVGKGHPATVNYLTGVENPRRRKQVSLDQVAARAVGSQTRFASLQLEAKSGNQKGRNLSWGRGGVPLPLVANPRLVFDRLFSRPQDTEKRKEALADAHSILDHVLEDARDLQRKLGTADREKLDEYMSAIREVEREIQKAEKFVDQPVGAIASDLEIPINAKLSVTQNSRLMYHLITLAFQADLTRVVTFRIPGENHAVSHHGKKRNKIKAFVAIQRRYMTELARLLQQLKATSDVDGTLLDHTMVLFGSGMGNASIHSTRKLPVLLAGGGFRHGRHLSFAGKRKRPLCDLYVTMLQRMGADVGKFSNSRGSMNDLLT